MKALESNVNKLNAAKQQPLEGGRVGYLLLYLLGVPGGLLLVMWVVLGDYIFKAG